MQMETLVCLCVSEGGVVVFEVLNLCSQHRPVCFWRDGNIHVDSLFLTAEIYLISRRRKSSHELQPAEPQWACP